MSVRQEFNFHSVNGLNWIFITPIYILRLHCVPREFVGFWLNVCAIFNRAFYDPFLIYNNKVRNVRHTYRAKTVRIPYFRLSLFMIEIASETRELIHAAQKQKVTVLAIWWNPFYGFVNGTFQFYARKSQTRSIVRLFATRKWFILHLAKTLQIICFCSHWRQWQDDKLGQRIAMELIKWRDYSLNILLLSVVCGWDSNERDIEQLLIN